MTKRELEGLFEEAQSDMADMYNKLQDAEMRIAYLEGVLDGINGRAKRKGVPMKSNPLVMAAPTEEEMNKLLEEEFGDCDEECKCPRCSMENKKMIEQYGKQKSKNLLTSSREIREWAQKHNVDVDNGDANDN